MRSLTLLLLIASTAHAGDRAVIAVGRCDVGEATTVSRAIRAVLSQRASAGVLSEEQTAAPFGGVPHGSLADAERLIAGARYDLYEQQALDRAERTLVGVIEDLGRLPPSDAVWMDIKTVRTQLAVIALQRNDKSEAARQLETIFRVEPDHRIDAALFPPSFRTYVDSLRAKQKSQPTFELNISTKPAGIGLFLDGRPLGQSPQTLRLPAGEYRVEARFEDARSMPRTVRISDRPESVELEQGFEGSIHTDYGLCIASAPQSDALPALLRVARILSVREIIAARFERRDDGQQFYVASVVNVDSGQELREGRIKLLSGVPPEGALERLADFLATGSAQAPVEAIRGANAPVVAHVEQPAHPAVAPPNHIATYIVGGAGAVALGGAVYFLTGGNRSQTQMDELCPDGTCASGDLGKYGEYKSDRDSRLTTGWILGGAGAAALAVGTIMYFMPSRPNEARASIGVSLNRVTLTLEFE